LFETEMRARVIFTANGEMEWWSNGVVE
jgi:hypothetical protein